MLFAKGQGFAFEVQPLKPLTNRTPALLNFDLRPTLCFEDGIYLDFMAMKSSLDKTIAWQRFQSPLCCTTKHLKLQEGY